MAERRVSVHPVLSLYKIRLQFPETPQPVIADLSLKVEAGEFVTLVGSSGVGKSTLLRAVDELIPVQAGQVQFGSETAQTRRERAFVFQDARLLPWRKVLGNVSYGLETLQLSRQESLRRAREALALVGLSDYAERYPHQLSGGQRQRVGIARALATEPKLLLMDEPFGALDAITRRELQDELVRIWQQTGAAILFVTHDMEEAVFLSDRVLLLAGSPARVQKDYVVDRPRPRVRADAHLFQLAATITGDLATIN